MDKREQAKSLMVHYFRTVFRESGMAWYSDHQAEIEAAVDLMIDAAKEELEEKFEKHGPQTICSCGHTQAEHVAFYGDCKYCGCPRFSKGDGYE